MKDCIIETENLTKKYGNQSIARALALKPEVLILDEATSNLDPITERKICDNLKKLHITQIIITHRLSQVEDADMIYVLNHGEIMEKGSHEQLMKGKVYR